MSIDKPHDSLMKAVFGRIAGAKALLATLLPEHIVAELDLDTLRVENVNAVANHLGQGYADLLFSVSARGTGGDTVLIHLLIEHKSSAERFTILDLYTSSALILDDWKRRHAHATTVPLVIPILLHHDAIPFAAPRVLRDLFAGDEALKRALDPLIPSLPIVLIDLVERTDDDFDRVAGYDPAAGYALWLLKWSRAADFATRLLDQGHRLRRVLAELHGDRTAEPLLRYVFIMLQRTTPLDKLARHIGDVVAPAAEEMVMSLAQKLIDEGIEKGMEKGMEKGIPRGERRALLAVLEARFGAIPDAVRVAIGAIEDTATLDQLARVGATAGSLAQFTQALPR